MVSGQRSAVSGQRSAVSGDSNSSSGKVISFREFYKFCEDICSKFGLSHTYFDEHSLRLYNTIKFIVKVTGGKKGLTLLAPGSGVALAEAYLSRFMGFKCTVLDLPGAVSSFKKYYDWAGFEAIGADIDDYICNNSTKFDIVMSLENIEHINAAPSEYVAKFTGSIAPGGYFIISTPNMGSFAHVFRILAMMPTLPVPEKTFDRNSHVHYREYMPCEIIEAYEKNGLVYKSRAYSNESPAFRKYNTSRRSLHHVKNPVLSSVMRWTIQPLMALIGVIPRFRYDMILAAQKV